ncbi:alanine racemase [Halobacillus salinarum]|uniref:Alanine racemase n=1 Tax=Halobacillus salinarum TaxID=2932257 RepID=A0ABY4EIP7_9BACI|nr:alanine racemase [Halobacillus salinarum]UOQ44350.1 alanine racemase [Halobacillus salinarum]
MSIETFYRDSWAEIDLSAVDYNIKQLKNRLYKGTKVYAVVKANAYGHGDVQVAEQALKSGAEALAVSLLDEAIKLREAGIEAPILVMGWIRPEDAPVAASHQISVTVFQAEWLQKVSELQLPTPLKVHMKWDTGMGRIGIRSNEEMDEILSFIRKTSQFQLEAVYTHFATADEEELDYYEEQSQRFESLMTHLREVWKEPFFIHTGNSAASMRFPGQMKQFVRYGISMYGLYPSPLVKKEKPIDLKPAFALKSRLVHVKKMEAGEAVSYGATYRTSSEEWIGTVPLGYADGWIRKLQGMDVIVDGKRHQIVGRICMDQFMIRLDQEYPVGTMVTLIGKEQQAEVSADEVAAHLETINYEIPCMISSRVPRVYLRDGRIIDVENSL